MKSKTTHFVRWGLLLLVLVGFRSIAQDSRGVRFNDDWRFFNGDGVGFEQASFDDSQWSAVTLPHDWSVEGPFSDKWASATGYLPAGTGWYRKSFEVTKDQQQKTTYLYFDGVYKNSEVWINGQYLGKRPNGSISFFYDLTKHLVKGKNVVAVKVDHTDFADARWYTGSGIYRNVYLLRVDPVHIDIWGVQFTTPEVSMQKAVAHVNIQVKNVAAKNKHVTVVAELFFGQKSIRRKETNLEIKAAQLATASLDFTVDEPALWSIEKPNLYQLKTSLLRDGVLIDSRTEQVGFRYFNFDADKGFTLNGVSIKLKGVCIHEDAGVFGAAVPAGVWEQRMKTLKAMGCNAIRMSHNPHQDYLYDLCDRMGFLVQDEAFDEWAIGKNKWIAGWNVGKPGNDGTHSYFQEWSDRDVTDMILRNRNRTCIIMWSIGNEIDYPNDPYTHEVLNTGRNPQIYGKGHQPGNPPARELGEIAKRLVATAKKADLTRPITAALAGVVMSNETQYPELLDVVGYNYQEYRYEDDHKKYPKRIIYGSENGKSYDAWKAVEENDFIAGQFLWTGLDFLGEARSWPNRSSSAGLIDMAGFPKPQYYHRKALWTSDPTLHFTVSKIQDRNNRQRWARPESHWNWQSGDSLLVTAYTNLSSVELLINGKSQGRKLLSERADKTFSWKVKFEPGQIELISHDPEADSKKYTLHTSLDPSRFALTSSSSRVSIHPDSVARVTLGLHDKNGLPVEWTEREIEISVTGSGKLLGIESGDIDSHEDYRSARRKTFKGKLVVYVGGTKPGTIKVEAKSNGLTTALITIQAVN